MEKLLFLTGELFGFTFSLAIKLLNIDDHIWFASLFCGVS
jgi:hypothetical protein